ncbi:carboxylesterase 5A-like isoform X2 [Cheilinus undulatus]|uniref:carboxylesterase 5A-like isoform X2 n=1 Tax=Cheilinus undulatus TaxID=241271 RepID=UPI001BD1FC5B|nr:carboxylesterase 5A-like isoform X2 [Cheilinus undulatus]XP_041670461.1 carboxylesterase 5A-like isoform X2 [Cheilinus undulatus]
MGKYTFYIFLNAALLLQCCFAETERSGPVVALKTGTVRGRYVAVKGAEQVEVYLGVPYARPPLGQLRFTAPQPAEPWEGVRGATELPKRCLQETEPMGNEWETFPINYPTVEMSEDCLYLNVYRPAGTASGDKLPVMVWIHGGALATGAASEYDGSALAAYHNVVVVIIQYRLNILGFLSTGDKHAPGNWGFLDQIACLHWVHDNIAALHGDPNSVTIFGTAGISVSLLTLSPLAEGLFHRAIPMSGVVPLEAEFTSDPLTLAQMMASASDCESDDNEELVQCMRGRTEEEMLSAIKKFQALVAPAVDGVFLTSPLEEVLKSQKFQKVPVLLGATNHEFGWMLPWYVGPPGWDKGMTREDVLSVLEISYPFHAPGANEAILNEYLQEDDSPESIRDAFTEIFGDLILVLPILKVSAHHRDAGVPVYFYEFQHSPQMFRGTRPSFVKADHYDDISFFLGYPFLTGDISIKDPVPQEEEELSRIMMAYIANFACNGSPNGPGLVEWPRYDHNESYLKLNLQQTVGQRLKQNRAHFMDVVLPAELGNSHPASDEL